jgi:hypothetical protein
MGRSLTMVYASPPPRRARNRDSQAEVETHVYVRPTPHAWRNVFLQPWTPSDPPLPWTTAVTIAPRPAPAPAPAPAAAATATATSELDETLARKVVRRRRSIMPWVVFLTAFGIAYGIGRDRALRAELGTELRVTTARAIAVLETTATRLGRQRD